MSLIKSLIKSFKAKAHATHEKHRNPIEEMRYGRQKLKDMLDDLQKKWIESQETEYQFKRRAAEYEKNMNRELNKAKEAKDGGNDRAARIHATRAACYQEFLEQRDEGNPHQRFQTELMEVIEDLRTQDLRLEIEVQKLEDAHNLADLQIQNSQFKHGIGDSNNINRILEDARERVAQLQDRASAHKDAEDTFGTYEDTDTNDRVEKILSGL